MRLGPSEGNAGLRKTIFLIFGLAALLIATSLVMVACATGSAESSAGTTTPATTATSLASRTTIRADLVQPAPPDKMPEDFGFVASFGVLGRNTIDTIQGTVTKDLGLQEEPATTKLALPPEVLASLYADLAAIENQWHIFSQGFVPDLDPGNSGTTMMVTPCDTYRLRWRAESFSSVLIDWEDSSLTPDPKAVALRSWFDKLERLIEATPEWKSLPEMKGGYV